MTALSANPETMPVVRGLADFDCRSGNRLERTIFNHRLSLYTVP